MDGHVDCLHLLEVKIYGFPYGTWPSGNPAKSTPARNLGVKLTVAAAAQSTRLFDKWQQSTRLFDG